MKIESGYDKVWQAGCRECNYLNFGCGHHEERPSESAELSLKAEARIEELEEIISKLMDKARHTLCSSQFDELDEYLESLLENK